MGTVLDLRGVSKDFAAQRVVDDVWLAVEEGSFFSLLGPSGCGKTTTLRLVAGFENPTSGEILLRGSAVTALRPYQRNVSTVFQNYALFPHLSVRGNVEFGLRHRGRLGRGEIERRVRKVLEQVQLEGKEDRKPSGLSGGEKQRVALARSLVLAPDVLLLDEPLSALDARLRKDVRAELKLLQRRTGVTFLFVTHDQEEALSLSDRIAVMNRGRIEQTGSPRDVYLHPKTRFVADFLGTVNWINGVGLRPEVTHVSPHRPQPGTPFRAAVVENSVFLGGCVRVEARLQAGEPIVAEVPRTDGEYRPGDPVCIWWRPEDELKLPPES